MAAATGQWEGWERDRRRNRPGRRLVAQDTDLDYGTRETLMAEAQVLQQTFPIASRIPRIFSNHVVGSCAAQWNTGEDEVDRIYENYWKAWMVQADLTGQHHFQKLVKIGKECEFTKGDHFIQKVKLERGIPLKVRSIEADRVTNAKGQINIDEDNIIGGIIIGQYGKPLKARVCDRDRYGNFKNPQDIPFTDLYQLWDTSRADSYRAVTRFKAVLNVIRDMKEAIGDEMTSLKANSALAILVRNATGTSQGWNSYGEGDGAPQDASGADAANAIKQTDLGGGRIVFSSHGDSIEAHKQARPGNEWMQFMEMMIRLIAVGADLPFSVVWNMAGLGGPGVRFDIKQAERTFTAEQERLENQLLNPLAAAVISDAIQEKRVPPHPNWNRYRFPRPPYISIDLGRDTKAGIDEINAGLNTAQNWCAENSMDYYDVIRQRAKEIRAVKDVAKEFDIDPQEIRLLTPNGNLATQPEEEKQEQQPAEPKKK